MADLRQGDCLEQQLPKYRIENKLDFDKEED